MIFLYNYQFSLYSIKRQYIQINVSYYYYYLQGGVLPLYVMLYQKISEVIISKIKSSMRLSLWFMCYGLNFQLIWRKYQWGLKRGIILTWNPRKDNFEKKINIPWECEWPTTSVGADPLGFRIKGPGLKVCIS